MKQKSCQHRPCPVIPGTSITDYMAGTQTKRTNTPPPAPEVTVETLGLDGFIEPDDQGLSLNELSQAYAALLAQGADPYPQETDSALADPLLVQAKVEIKLPPAEKTAEPPFEITPRSILEAILFVGHPSGEPFTSERMAALMRGVRPAEIDDLVCELNVEFKTQGAPYTIESAGPGYRLSLRPEFAALAAAFHGRIREARLSQAAIDILAIVGYHQPVAAPEIERLRGKPNGALLSQLIRRDLLALERPTTKSEAPKYRTTSRFLEIFGLDSLAELPRSHDV
jgi:segregation and condensation protein B